VDGWVKNSMCTSAAKADIEAGAQERGPPSRLKAQNAPGTAEAGENEGRNDKAIQSQ